MNLQSLMRRLLTTAAAICTTAAAYDSENAVPLTLGLEAGKVTVEKIAVKLNGREVTVSVTLQNSGRVARRVGWYANTPQFSLLGDGEEHLDKSFADIRARFNGVALTPQTYQRGYFMGRDITPELTKAGLAPLPDLQADEKRLARLTTVQGLRPEQWQGYVAYAWAYTIPRDSGAQLEVQYRALPQFALVDLDSSPFSQAVQQHCGDPEVVRRRLLLATHGATQVMVERYEMPLAFMLMREVQLEIAQPTINWQQAHPLISLVCGLNNESHLADAAGTVNANLALSVLVLSLPPGVVVGEVRNGG